MFHSGGKNPHPYQLLSWRKIKTIPGQAGSVQRSEKQPEQIIWAKKALAKRAACCELTDHGLQDAPGDVDELLVDLDGEVAQHLAVLSQVKVLQAVLVLLRRVLGHETLNRKLKHPCSLSHPLTVHQNHCIKTPLHPQSTIYQNMLPKYIMEKIKTHKSPLIYSDIWS